MKIAILGSTGMLGSMVKRVLSAHSEYEIVCPSREFLDAEAVARPFLMGFCNRFSYVINCIGIIKPKIDEWDWRSIARASRVNSEFPTLLADAAERTGCRVLQIATDCVYSGLVATSYNENAKHDATDVYGKTKSLGEVRSFAVRHLRCSIIGPELKSHQSLLDWFLQQPEGARIKGYTNHYWNGITTLTFARLCHAIVSDQIEFSALPLVQHVVPFNVVTKAELLSIFSDVYNRQDIAIEETEAPTEINRSLSTTLPGVNDLLWRVAGYIAPPSIASMVQEMAAYK